MSDNEELTEANAVRRTGISKRVRVMGPMDRYVTRSSPSGASLDERREQAKLIVTCIGAMNNLPKKFMNSKCTKKLIELLSQNDPSSYHFPTEEDLRGRLLTDQVNQIKKRMLKQKEAWEKHGCSILVDVWSDQWRRCLVNIYVHSQLGTRFINSVATSKHNVEFYMVELIARCVKAVGPNNVVQIVCDGTPLSVEACESIQEDWPHIFRIPCASYLIEKMLDSVCALPRAKSVLFKAKALVGFIYSHKSSLRLLEQIIGKQGLVRVGVTGPTTTFFILRRLLTMRSELVNMFTEDECKGYKWWGHPEVDAIIGVVHDTDFWRNLYLTFRVMGPLVKVLYVVHSLTVPPMGFIYAAMQQAKDEMKKACLNQERLYKPVLEIIDRIWGASADMPLYLAGYYLNPFYFYGNREIEKNESVMNGLMACVQQMYADDAAVQNKIIEELGSYRAAQGPFGRKMAVLQRSDPNINPDNWWALFGYKTPHLQALARRVLNLTCTSSQLEKCWNTFEKVFYDKDFEPDPEVRNKLMFAHANLKLEEKWERKHKDPLAAYHVDNAYAWIADTVSEDDDIVAPVTGLELDSELDPDEVPASESNQNSYAQYRTELKVTDESYDSGNEGEEGCGIDVEDYFDEDDTLGTGMDWTGEDEYLRSLDNVKDWN